LSTIAAITTYAKLAERVSRFANFGLQLLDNLLVRRCEHQLPLSSWHS
jgi:hypothetical protein